MMLNYVDEAVVEVQAQERGAHAWLHRDGLLHDPLDCGQRRRARLVVEVRVQQLRAAWLGDQQSKRHCRDARRNEAAATYTRRRHSPQHVNQVITKMA